MMASCGLDGARWVNWTVDFVDFRATIWTPHRSAHRRYQTRGGSNPCAIHYRSKSTFCVAWEGRNYSQLRRLCPLRVPAFIVCATYILTDNEVSRGSTVVHVGPAASRRSWRRLRGGHGGARGGLCHRQRGRQRDSDGFGQRLVQLQRPAQPHHAHPGPRARDQDRRRPLRQDSDHKLLRRCAGHAEFYAGHGALLPGIGGSSARLGYVEVLYVTELIGLTLIWLGYRAIVADTSASVHANQGAGSTAAAPV